MKREFTIVSLLVAVEANAGELLPALPVVVGSFRSSDRNNRVIHASAVAESDLDSVEMTFTTSCARSSVAQETVAHSGAKERCVKEV